MNTQGCSGSGPRQQLPQAYSAYGQPRLQPYESMRAPTQYQGQLLGMHPQSLYSQGYLPSQQQPPGISHQRPLSRGQPHEGLYPSLYQRAPSQRQAYGGASQSSYQRHSLQEPLHEVPRLSGAPSTSWDSDEDLDKKELDARIDFLLGGGGFGHAPSGGPIPAPTVPQGQRFGQSEYPQNSRSFRRPNEETQQPKPARPKGVLKAKRPLNDHRISKNVKTANKTLNRAIRNWDAREEKEKKYQKTLEPILLRNPSIRAELVEPPGSRKRRHGLIEKELAPVDTIGVINSDRSLLATKDFDHGRRKRVRRVIEEDDCTENPHADFQSSIARSSEETTRVIQSESAMPIDQHPSQAGSHNPTRREAASGENLQPSLSTHGGTVPETSPSPVMFHYPTRELDARGSTGPFGSDPDIELKNHRKRVRELIGDPDCFGYLPEPKRRRTSLPVVPSTPASTLLQGKKGKSRVQRNNFPARVADYHRKAGQNLQHDESVAQNGVTQETAMPIITEFSDIVPFSLDMDQCIQDALSPIREMYFDATGSPAPETNQLDSYVLRYRKILAAWEKWSGTPVNYSEEPPLSSKEAQCIVDALLPTRMMFYEWTGEGAPKINRMNSYGDQFREIHAVFEEWWEANFLDPLPLLVGLNAWYGSMDNFESPVKDSLYYEAYKLGHRAPRDQYGRIENIYGPFLEDTTRNLFWW